MRILSETDFDLIKGRIRDLRDLISLEQYEKARKSATGLADDFSDRIFQPTENELEDLAECVKYIFEERGVLVKEVRFDYLTASTAGKTKPSHLHLKNVQAEVEAVFN